MNPWRKPLFIEAAKLLACRVGRERVCLAGQRADPVTVPYEHIGQLTVRIPDDGLLALMADLVRRNRPVQLVDSRGTVIARLTPDVGDEPGLPFVMDLCDALNATNARRYPDWRDTQARHLLSLIFRRHARAHKAIPHLQAVLRRHARWRLKCRPQAIEQIENILVAQTQALAQTVINERRLKRLEITLKHLGYDLVHDLAEILRPWLLWDYLKAHAADRHPTTRKALAHFTAQQNAISDTLVRHLKALPAWIQPRRPARAHTTHRSTP